MDGSLTGLGGESYAAAYFRHNEQPECTVSKDVHDSVLCPASHAIRRVAFHGMENANTFRAMLMKFIPYDDSEMEKLTDEEKATYLADSTNLSEIFYKEKQSPSNGWAVPFVTGHKYRAWWDNGQLDFTRMRIEVSNQWKPEDEYILFNFPFVDGREAVDFFGKYGGSFAADGESNDYYANGSLTNTARENWLSGYNVVDNELKKEIDFVINGRTESSKTIEVDGIRCRDGLSEWCVAAPTIIECTGEQLMWDDPASWAYGENPGKVPEEGENAVVPPGVIIIFNIEESPILELLTINGCLNFLSDGSKDQHLRAHQIYVQGGQLEIGKSAVPYTRKATITLFGEESADVIVMDGATEAGNKLIANNGVLSFVGLSRSREARLFAVANKGDSTVTVTLGLDWEAGDELSFIATAM